jgi:hypothetical protein
MKLGGRGWSGELVARLGYLVGRNYEVETIVARLGLSEHAVRNAIRRWHVPLCSNAGRLPCRAP